jgi:serine/threonine protein kinase
MEKLKENESRAEKIMNIERLSGGLFYVPNLKVPSFWDNHGMSRFLEKDNIDNIIHHPKCGKQLADDIIEIGYGMHNLYKMGIQYRDIHKGNIMFNSKGKPVIIDIGFSSGSSGTPKVFEDRLL